MKTNASTSCGEIRVSLFCVLAFSLTLSAAVTTARSDTVTFTDGDFTGWIAGPAFPTTYPAQGGALENSGGNDGAFYRVTTLTNEITYTAFFHPFFTFDPSSVGVVDAVNFSIDVHEYHTFWQGMGFGLAVMQDGQVFLSGTGPTSGQATTGWKTFYANPPLTN